MLLKYFYLIIIYMYIKKKKQIMLKVNQSAEPVISIAMGYQAKPKMKLPILAVSFCTATPLRPPIRTLYGTSTQDKLAGGVCMSDVNLRLM